MDELNKGILTPKKSIKSYCLMWCNRKERKNSKKDVARCPEYRCPLYPYRFGLLKRKTRPISEITKTNRLEELIKAQKQVENAELRVKSEWKKLESLKIERKVREEEKRKLMEYGIKREIKEYRAKTKELVREQESRYKNAELRLEKLKERFDKMDDLCRMEIESGLWGETTLEEMLEARERKNADRSEIDEPEECAQEDEQTSETEGE